MDTKIVKTTGIAAALVIIAVIGLVFLTGNDAVAPGGDTQVPPMAEESETPNDTEEGAGIANPASTNCVEKGGTIDIRTGEDGGQVGYCLFEDGTECEEWAYFRGECGTE